MQEMDGNIDLLVFLAGKYDIPKFGAYTRGNKSGELVDRGNFQRKICTIWPSDMNSHIYCN